MLYNIHMEHPSPTKTYTWLEEIIADYLWRGDALETVVKINAKTSEEALPDKTEAERRSLRWFCYESLSRVIQEQRHVGRPVKMP